VPDPAHAGDYVLDRCPPEWVHDVHPVDARDQLPPPAQIAEYAELMLTARRLEHASQSLRLVRPA